MGRDYEPEGWLVSTTTALFDASDSGHRLEVGVIAVDRDLSEWAEWYPIIQGARALPLDEALPHFVESVAQQYPDGYIDSTGLVGALSYHVRIPLFGSPPYSWEKLGELLSTAGPFGTAVVIAHDISPQMSVPVLFLVGAGISVMVNVVQPGTRAFGEAIAYRIRQWGGLEGERVGTEETEK